MNKEELIAMGLSEEQASKVMASLDGSFVPKNRFNEVNEENKTLKKSVTDRDKQLEDLKKSSGDNEKLQSQIAELQKQNADQVKAHELEMNRLKVDNAIEQALTGAKAKNVKAVKALLDLEGVKLSDDGTITGLKEQIDKLSKDDGTKFLFDTAESSRQQTFRGFQPGNANVIPNAAQAGYEARLAEARKNSNTLEVIKIKQEAANEGVFLM